MKDDDERPLANWLNPKDVYAAGDILLTSEEREWKRRRLYSVPTPRDEKYNREAQVNYNPIGGYDDEN